ncbi:MAG: cobalamin-dependent protein [Chitinophagales bacterium]|nr:cobalamin-dependent protein [Chitinophagales bacterium]
MNQRIILINAPSLGTIEHMYDEPDFVRLSLAALAAYIRLQGNYDILLIDAKFEGLTFDTVLNRAKDFNPDLVGFTAFTNEIKPCAYLAARIKNSIPNCKTLVGGAHFTALPITTMKQFPMFDYGVFGEGEITFHELLNALKYKLKLEEIKGLVYRDIDGVIKKNPPRERVLDLDELPIPAWDLYPRANTYWIQTMRGCPFDCVFCMNHNGRVSRKNSVDRVMRELEYIVNTFSPEWIRPGDELFTVDKGRTSMLMDKMIENGIHKRFKWDVQTHVRYVDYALLVKMKQAGVTQIDMGVESGNDEILKAMGKGTRLNYISKAFEEARNAGVRTGSLLILGQPDETKETIENTLLFAAAINADEPMFSIMIPFPGTKVAKLASKGLSGYRLLTYDWDMYRQRLGGVMTFAGLSPKQIDRLLFLSYLRVMFMRKRYIDIIKLTVKYWKSAKTLLYKNLKFSNPEILLTYPKDYKQTLGDCDTLVEASLLVEETDAFSNYQKEELQRVKTILPKLLREQKMAQ